ncbi:hypothetical protein LguiB_035392 [Lonicera macranthoides]
MNSEAVSLSPNHPARVVSEGMGDCHLLNRARRTPLVFIKCTPTAFNAPKFMEKQGQNWY